VTLSLDTNALVEIVNGGRPEVRVAFQAAVDRRADLVVSVLVAHELTFGARFGGRRAEVEAAEGLLSTLAIEPFTASDAEGAARVRLALEKIGRRIGAMDMLIAGQALNRGWTVVTANVHEFGRVAGLRVEDWTAAPQSR
jgi:tRNA(fMet)-specific endonuclease VapC